MFLFFCTLYNNITRIYHTRQNSLSVHLENYNQTFDLFTPFNYLYLPALKWVLIFNIFLLCLIIIILHSMNTF